MRDPTGCVRGALQYTAHVGVTPLQAVLASGPIDRDAALRWGERHGHFCVGSMWFVLRDDLDDGTAVALALDKITAIAALPDDFDLDDLLPQERLVSSERGGLSRPWRPPSGTPVPPGHVPCPCGSGERYRNCCRRMAQA